MTPIAVAIVNYNTRELLRTCMETVLQEQPSEVVVVDNASCDGSAEMVESTFPLTSLIVNRANRGYGAGANQGIAGCRAKYVLLLNSDTLLQSGTLRELAAFLDQNPKVALVGPRMVNRDGTLQASCFHFPTPFLVFLDKSNLGRLIGYLPMLREVYLRTWSHGRARRVPWVLGAALGIRREAFEAIGGFDESFFMYYEEVDLCYRLRRGGWHVYFAPVADIVHKGGASTEPGAAEMKVELFRSLVRFYERHYSRFRLFELLVLIRCIAAAGWLRDTAWHALTQNERRREMLAVSITAWEGLLQRDWRSQFKPQ